MEVAFEAYRLAFHSGLHVGNREGALESTETIVRSDTLFSAFLNGYRLLFAGPKFIELTDRLAKGDPPFRFSSAFPFIKDTYYLPIPLNQIPLDKQSKKILYMAKRSWERLIKGESLEALLREGDADILPRPTGDHKTETDKTPWTVLNTPRVGLNRHNDHPGERYFNCGEVHFDKHTGLYFLAQYQGEAFRDDARAVWRLLADEGLGGDRTVGKGLFNYPRPELLTFHAPDGAGHWVALALYYPADGETIGLSQGFYDLVPRQGYVYSQGGRSLRRCPVTMFSEGSVFPGIQTRTGKLVEVTPEYFSQHVVYRSGLGLGLPCMGSRETI